MAIVRRRKPAYKRKSAPKKYKKKVARPLKNAIMKVIHSTQETKFATKDYGPSPFNGIISSKTEWLYPCPNVDMAGNTILASNNTRVGDTIQPISNKVFITVSLGNEVLRSVDIMVKVYVFFMKTAKSQLAVASVTDTPGASQFLDGGSSNQIFDGETTTLDLPINQRVYTPIKTFTFRLAKAVGYINGGAVADTYVDGSSTTFKHLSVNIPLPKSFKYGDDASVQPQNYCPIIAVGYAHMDGTAPDNVSQDIKVAYRSNLYFKDS